MFSKKIRSYFNSNINVSLVFNVHFNGLGVIRSLAKKGIPVIALDCSNNSLGKCTRFAPFYKVPNPKIQEKEFIKSLIEFGKNFKNKPVLFPTNDIWSVPVSKYREDLAKFFLTYNPSFKVLDIIINKREFYYWCKKNGFNIPNIYKFNDVYSLTEKDFPLVIKPITREMSTDNLDQKLKSIEYHKNRLITIKDKKQLKDISKNLSEEEYILQEKVIGNSSQMYTVGVYADSNNNVIGLFCGKKIRGYPYEFGDCVAGESLYIKELADMSISLIKKIKYTGIAEIEFKKDITSGEYKLIEINPRTWSWVGIVPYTGVDLPFIAYNDLVYNIKQPEIIKSVDNILWVRLIDDIINNLFLYPKGNRKSLFSLIKQYRKYKRVIIAETNERDYKVLFYYIYLKIKVLSLKILNKVGVTKKN